MPLYRLQNSDNRLQSFRSSALSSFYQERELENWLEANPQVLVGDEPLLIIGRQVNTPVGIIDLLALDSDGTGVIVELKRAPNQREVIAQALEYVSWLSSLDGAAISEVAGNYFQLINRSGTLSEAWQQTFNTDLNTATLNARQRTIVVIEGDDERIASVARFLRSSGLDIILLTYNYYRTQSGEELLDIEKPVGEDEPTSALAAPAASRPTEEGVMRQWPEEVAPIFAVFREHLTHQGLTVQAKKSGISFYEQTRDGLVFICFVTASANDMSVWLRSDSLQLRFDFQATSEAIKRSVAPDVRVFHSKVWFILTFPLRKDRATEIAESVLREVVAKIE